MRSEEKQAVRIAENATPDRLISFLTSNAVLWFGTLLALISAADGVRNSILHSPVLAAFLLLRRRWRLLAFSLLHG